MSADAAVEEDAGEYETMSADAAEEEDAGEYEAETRGLLDGSAATPGPAAPAPPPPLRSVMLALVPIAYVPGFFQSLYEYVIDPVMPLYAKSLGCNDTEVGIIVAGMLIGSMCFNIPAGVAVSRFGSTPVFVASMVICSIAAGCMLAATGFASLLFAQLFSGLGSSLFNVGVSSLIRNATPAQYRGRVISIKGGLGRMAMMVSSAIGGLVAQRYGLKAPFLLRALLPLLSLLVFVLTNCCGGSSSGHPAASPSPSPKGGGGSGSSSDRSIYDADAPLSTCGVIRLARTELCTAGYVAFSIMGVRNARRIVLPLAGTSVGLSVAEIGGAMSLMGAADSLCFPLVGVLSDRYGRKFTGVPAYTMLAVGFLILGSLDPSSGGLQLTLAALTIGIGNGMSSGIISMMGADVSPKLPNTGRFMGVWAVLDDCGGALGPFLVGVLAQEVSVFFAATSVGGWALGSAIFFWLGVRETHKQTTRQPPAICCR